MPMPMHVRGTLDQVILNDDNLYEGNLVPYFKISFFKAKNLNNPFHNFRHMMHVTWLCHEACIYYKSVLSKREMRNLLIAAMFHDFDHKGILGPDINNIEIAVAGLEKHILPEDLPYLKIISDIIRSTEYPYKIDSDSYHLCVQILRDADLSQALNVSWLQQVIFGLSAEWNMTPYEVLKIQTQFHNGLNFCTSWAKDTWPKEEIDKKIDEVNSLLRILE